MTGDFLTREIIRRMLGDVGVAPPPNFGKVGISIPELRLRHDLTFSMEDGNQHIFPLWAGEISVDPDVKIRALLCDLSIDDVSEYALALRITDKPIYGLKLIYDNDDNGIFVISENDGWKPANMTVKTRALIGMETIMDQGMEWGDCSEIGDLEEAITRIAEM